MPDENTIPTTRNLIDFDVGPVRRFTGILDSLPKESQTYGEGEKARTSQRITANFSAIEVLEAIEPYHFPTFTFQMGESNRKKSRWGVFGESFNAIADSQYSEEQLDQTNLAYVKPSDRLDIKDCFGKRFGLVLADGEDGRPEPPMLFDGRAGEDKPTPAWTIYEIEGIGVAGGQGINPAELAESLLDGKTLADFNKEALANPVIQNATALLQAISLPPSAVGSFANALVAGGKFTKDAQGVFHKKVAEVAQAGQ